MMRKMFWVDLEMTGLDENSDRILEVAVIISDLDLKPIETFHRIVFQPPEILENMNEWCRVTHGKSGLTAQVAHGAALDTVEKELLDLVGRHFPASEKIVLCGNSVGMDKRFIDKHLPKLAQRTHYRVVDVTSFKEVFRAKFNVNVQKSDGHRALDDILESIKELQTYLSYVRVDSTESKVKGK